MGIKHTKVSAIADAADTTKVRPSDWNTDHTIDGTVNFNGHLIVNCPSVVGGTGTAWGVNVRDFGALGDGVTDDTTAFQDAIDFLITQEASGASGSGGALLVPQGNYQLTSLTIAAIVPADPCTINIYGEGRLNTSLNFSGTPAILTSRLWYFHWANFSINGVGTPAVGVLFGRLDSSGTGTFEGLIEEVGIGGFVHAVSTKNITYAPGNGSDLVFNKCQFQNNTIGVFVEGFNSLNFNFYGCHFGQCSDAGIYVASGGSVNVWGGSSNGNGADFKFLSSDENYSVNGFRAETTNVFLILASGNCTITDCDARSNSPSVDGYIQVVSGHLTIDTSLISDIHVGTTAKLILRNSKISGNEPFFNTLQHHGTPLSLLYKIENCEVNGAAFQDEEGVVRNGPRNLVRSINYIIDPTDSTNWGLSPIDQVQSLFGTVSLQQLPIINPRTGAPTLPPVLWNDNGTLKLTQPVFWDINRSTSFQDTASDTYTRPVDLSNNNLTVSTSLTTVGSGATILATVGRTTGKWYWEASCGSLGDVNAVSVGPGFAESIVQTQSGIGVFTDHAAHPSVGLTPANNVHDTDSGERSTTLTYTAGDIIQMAVDIDARLFWWRVNNAGNWNNVGGNPATGVGGFNLTLFTNGVFPAISVQRAATATAFTARFLSSAFTYSPPAGFSAWDAGV